MHREGVPASQTRIRFFTQNIERVHYSIAIERDGDERYAVFEVAAYRKPDFAVQVTSEQPRYVGAGKVAFLTKATYTSDGKASLELSWGKEGFYRLRVTATDDKGHSTETSIFLHIWGREYCYLSCGSS